MKVRYIWYSRIGTIFAMIWAVLFMLFFATLNFWFLGGSVLAISLALYIGELRARKIRSENLKEWIERIKVQDHE